MHTSLSPLPDSYWATPEDAIAYTHRSLLGAIALCACYIATATHLIPLWTLLILSALILPRWMINLHELFHLYDEQQVNPYIRLMGISPLPLSLISLSYQQLKALHAGHHVAPATDADPDAYHIRGSWMGTLINAFIAPEKSTLRWLFEHGMTRTLAIDMLIKLCLFMGLAWLGKTTFIWFWLSLRCVYGLGDFVFFRLVHHRNGDYGTFELPVPEALISLGELLFGKTVVQATIHHDIHHQNPRIAAHALSKASAFTQGHPVGP